MANRIEIPTIDVRLLEMHARLAVCQSLTGCVLARAAADALGLPEDSVEVGWESDWTTPNAMVITANWDKDNHRCRAKFWPFDKAAYYFSLNDESRCRLVRNFQSEVLQLVGGYGWVPDHRKQRRPMDATNLAVRAKERAYTKGYKDGQAGRPWREESELDSSESYGKYLKGHAAGTNRRNNGLVKSMPKQHRSPRPRRIAVM